MTVHAMLYPAIRPSDLRLTGRFEGSRRYADAQGAQTEEIVRAV